jgi:dethiobiotin synthetase
VIPGKTVLIAGTDTAVGKTVVSVLLLAAWRRRGLSVLATKPVESGCDPAPEDALRLAAAAGMSVEDPDLCPYRLRLPVAPEAAADAEGLRVEMTAIQRAVARLEQRTDRVLVESAGGLGTPYAPGLLVLDLARHLQAPVLLVARAVLGTVGQTLVALRLLRHEGLRCAGVILCHTTEGPYGPEEPTNSSLIAAHAEGVPLLGTLPFLDEPMPPPADSDALRRWTGVHAVTLEGSIDLDRLQLRLSEKR